MYRSEKGAVSSGSTCWLHGAERLEGVIWTRHPAELSGDEETEGDLARRLWRSSWQIKSGSNSRTKSAGFKIIQRGMKLKEQRKQIILTPLDVGEDTVRHTVGRHLHGMTSLPKHLYDLLCMLSFSRVSVALFPAARWGLQLGI